MTGNAHEIALLERTLTTLVARTGFPVAFGGFAKPSGTELTSFAGTRTGALRGLVIKSGQGLGGLALARRQLTATGAYHESAEIIHSYDREVGGEGILALLAVPVVVDDRVRALIYAGVRNRTEMEHSTLSLAANAARRLAWELSVHEETQRRMAVHDSQRGPQTADTGPTQYDLAELYAELREISKLVSDPELATRIDVASALLRPVAEQPAIAGGTELSPRELDVVTYLALGKRNALIATHLGLAESTVKSYLASAMRKLEATNRFEVVLMARRQGLIR
ncbi:response regulator transcription factor [Glutamicibacter bergerei]|uniref:Response regulator transcription factor n=1 Tax=Glutamicibacter bergerei TaxID=256702 RepID=A0ABV9MME3_9MICC|nr:hypothetical protein [Micrococcaceae bacterium]